MGRGTSGHPTRGYPIATVARPLIRVGTAVTVPGVRGPLPDILFFCQLEVDLARHVCLAERFA